MKNNLTYTQMNKKTLLIAMIILLSAMVQSCDNPPKTPLPSTYLRLEVEKAKPKEFNDKDFPFTFIYPSNAVVEKQDSKSNAIKWFNLNYKKYNYLVNVSYIPLTTKQALHNSIEDCYTFLKRHQKLSGGIIQQDYHNEEKHVYGTVFEIKGTDVVSPMQFYLTDSTRYFVRFALNSNFKPNNDSCQVIINQLKQDLLIMVNSFSWK